MQKSTEQHYLIFNTKRYDYLASSVSKLGGFRLGKVTHKNFPDGERYLRIDEDIRQHEIVLLGGSISDSDTLELYDLACALVKYGAKSLTLIIPYFGYATMERAILPGEVVVAKTRARLFSAIPNAPGGNRVVLLDLHSEGLPHYFEGEIRPIHLYAKQMILEAVREAAQNSSFVLGCTDAGRAKWVQSLANELKCPAAIVLKRRHDSDHTEVCALSAQVSEQHVVIFDDMVRTGGSLIEAAKAYKSAGAKKLSAVATHAVLPADALNAIKATKLFSNLWCTDSHPRTQELNDGFLQIKSIAPLLVNFLRGVGSATY